MKKINLKGVTKILNEKELKNVMGGSEIEGCLDEWTWSCGYGLWCPAPPYGFSGHCSGSPINCECIPD